MSVKKEFFAEKYLALTCIVPFWEQALHYLVGVYDYFILFRALLLSSFFYLLHKVSDIRECNFKPCFREFFSDFPSLMLGVSMAVQFFILPLDLKDGIGYFISNAVIFGIVLFLYCMGDNFSFSRFIYYTVILLFPLFLINFFLSFIPSYYTCKNQFFGTFGNPQILSAFLLFFLTSLVMSYNLLQRSIFLLSLILALYLSTSVASRSLFLSLLFILVAGALNFSHNRRSAVLLVLCLFLAFIYFRPTILVRFLCEGNSRNFDIILPLLLKDHFLPHGLDTFDKYAQQFNFFPDSSFLEVIWDQGFLSLFLLVSIFSKLFQPAPVRFKLLFVATLIFALFERVLFATVSPINFFWFTTLYAFWPRFGRHLQKDISVDKRATC